ncbi:right-handed parallel beta-helix repeat-containing protein [Mesorhizobium australicum]|uniref:Right handed beta helix region n=1 Tax=Mesorhizobium australicum TaxID=536018 RepID=A0A1X7PBD7_9HYPH|nr:right-handed parallel beta-helix repeat-containing protein [Mesorhizobium australicum]SMH47746.1 Right handed beta helix region [Mesorhizobium australicum]
MKVSTLITAAAVAAAALIGLAGNASAQATRTWVSGVGDDVNPCSRTAPCKTFAGAISKTATNGIINCLDPAGFGAVTITKSITLSCEYTMGSILASGTTGIIINGADIDVVLRGIDIDGSGTTPGINGIRFLQGSSLIVEKGVFRDFNGASPNGAGIMVNATSGNLKLVVRDSVFTNNGATTSGAGIDISPTGSTSVTVSVEGSLFTDNRVGIRAIGTGTTGTIQLSVTDSEISNSTSHGLVVQADPGSSKVMVTGSQIVSNGDTGIRASGANTIVRVGSSVISGNLVGLNAINGANIRSYGNNQLNGNGTDGAFGGTIALQ